jgi:GNAT superfamily N-acetyltransferase
MIRYEQLQSHEVSRLRAIRLRALQDAPDAFVTTFEDSRARTDEDWEKQLAELPTFVAIENGRDLAMVRCMRDQHRADTAWLLSMWVAPEARRARVGSALVDVVVTWARSNGIARLVLDVADLNMAAVALYEFKGFRRNGTIGSLPPPRQHIREHQRELALD